VRYKALPIAARGAPFVPRHPATPTPPWHDTKLARFFATLVMLLALPALIVPMLRVAASPASIALQPASAVPGETVTVVGSGFHQGQQGVLHFDGNPAGMPEFRADPEGRFAVVFVVPSAPPGPRTVTAAAKMPPGAMRHEARVLAATTLTIIDPVVASTPVATSTPPTVTTTPTPAPPSPTATPDAPTPAPATPAPPTPALTPTPTPSHDGGDHGGGMATGPGCAGYSEPRVFTEAQAWWTTTPGSGGTDFGHLHVGACMPYKQPVSGVVTIDVRIIMHHNPGDFVYLNPVLKTDSQELSLAKNYSLEGLSCPDATCEAWATVSIDTRLSDFDGFQEIRIRAFVDEPDGNRMHASVNTLVDLRNGRADNPIDRRAYQRGKGWYTGSGYCEADILSDLPVAPVLAWAPMVQVVHHGAADDLPVSRYKVTLDADAHAGLPGIVIASGTGELVPTTASTVGLGSGMHRLAVRAECDDPRGSTNSGVLVVWFEVP
jgi:hypothetical protein